MFRPETCHTIYDGAPREYPSPTFPSSTGPFILAGDSVAKLARVIEEVCQEACFLTIVSHGVPGLDLLHTQHLARQAGQIPPDTEPLLRADR